MGYDNTRFSNLVYKIIGTPERWHSDYIDVMNQVLDDSAHIDDPKNVFELKIGDQILSQITNTNEAMTAFGSLLDNGRFRMVILDSAYQVIYHNKTAEQLLNSLLIRKNSNQLKPGVLTKLECAAKNNQELALKANHGNLSAVDNFDQNDEQVYLRSIHSQSPIDGSLATHYLVLVVDNSAKDKALNPEFTSRYELTKKEQEVLLKLTHGQTRKEIADSSFVSCNTIKTHMNSLYRKTGANSQADIVRMVLTDESQILDTYFGIRESILPILAQPAEDKLISLANGHRISYREYGPADGEVIIFCHNGYGSRVTIPKNYQQVCERYNKRVIVPERPGYGLTSYAKPAKWNAMLKEFIDLLDIKQYELMGAVIGSSVALNFASQADKRLSRVILCSPVFVNTQEDTEFLTGIFAPVTRLIKASRHITIEIYKLWLKSVTRDLSMHYGEMLKNSIGSAEIKQFTQDGTYDLMIDGLRQGSSKGLDGIANDMVDCLSPKNISLKDITVPVDIWWGTEDSRINREGINNLAKQIKHANVFVREGYSEHIFYALFDDILRATVAK